MDGQEPLPYEPPAGWHLLAGLAIIWSATVFLGILAAVWMLATGGDPSQMDPAVIVGITLADFVVTGVTTWFFVSWMSGRRFLRAFAIGPIRPEIAGAIALGSIAGATAVLFIPGGDSPMARLTETTWGFVAVGVLAVLAPPLEELYYRGFIQPVVATKLGWPAATAIVAIWFGGVHGAQYWGDWAALGWVAMMGAIWSVMRWQTGSLTPSLISHWVYNATVMVIATIGRSLGES